MELCCIVVSLRFVLAVGNFVDAVTIGLEVLSNAGWLVLSTDATASSSSLEDFVFLLFLSNVGCVLILLLLPNHFRCY